MLHSNRPATSADTLLRFVRYLEGEDVPWDFGVVPEARWRELGMLREKKKCDGNVG
jgi:hypothetical protein